MQALDDPVALAIAAKIKLLCETSGDRFLTFPLGLSLASASLAFMKEQSVSGLGAADYQLRYPMQFAQLVNAIPREDPKYDPEENVFTWDRYRQVLADAFFATSSLTESEKRQLDEARDFLEESVPDPAGGTNRTTSQEYLQYLSYKRAHDELVRGYANDRITVELSEGEEGARLKEAWSATKEKEWKDKIQLALGEWETLGYKSKVEHCQNLVTQLEPKQYYLSSVRSQFTGLCETAEIPDPDQMGAVGALRTTFSPKDAFEPNAIWSKLTLSGSEIRSLVAEAPAELREGHTVAADTNDIEGVELEYNRISIVRTWFKPDLFTSRYWKLGEDVVVSDGKAPAQGILPAFINNMIVARNIVVRRRKTAAPAQPIRIPWLVKARFGMAAPAAVAAAVTPPAVPPPAVAPPAVPPPAVAAPAFLHAAAVSPVVRDHRGGAHGVAPGFVGRRMPARVVPPPLVRRLFLDTSILTPKIFVVKPVLQPPVPSPEVTIVEERMDFDGVAVLAFECKRIPKSPDPDPKLQW